MYTRKYFCVSRETSIETVVSRERRLELVNKISATHEKLVEALELSASCYTFQIIIAFSAYVIYAIMSFFAVFNAFVSNNVVAIRNAVFMMNWNIFYTFTMTFLIYICSSTTKMVYEKISNKYTLMFHLKLLGDNFERRFFAVFVVFSVDFWFKSF